jgi:hypothetical protein
LPVVESTYTLHGMRTTRMGLTTSIRSPAQFKSLHQGHGRLTTARLK